ncbi:MAG: sigma-70 family RNA polymerase sigma factor [Clostridia bacterium]|nr:sigma-70 family RNA polymerase sigma factor [Clostridia bacterium]
MMRDAFICENMGLVHTCAKRFSGKGIEYDDLFQAGCVGLVKAVDGFDPQRGLCFSTYAVPLILGEIRHLFREGGAIKAGRALRALSYRVSRLREQMTAALGREPSVGELAAELQEDPEQVAQAVGLSVPPLSLTSPEGESAMDLPVESYEQAVTDRLALWQVMEELEPRDRALIRLRYLGRQTQQATADRLGMTQVQVSRREKVLLKQMREMLTV